VDECAYKCVGRHVRVCVCACACVCIEWKGMTSNSEDDVMVLKGIG
jgi:hypothetical protein